MARRTSLDNPGQLSLWQSVVQTYIDADGAEVSNSQMYQAVRSRAGIPAAEFDAKAPIGKRGEQHSPMARTARWAQQTLRLRGVLEKVSGKRGVWRLTKEARTELHRVERGFVILGLSTKLGVALWADCRDAMAALDEPIQLLLTSPPYAIQKARAYGGVKASEYVDFICSLIEPVIPKLDRGASVVLNLSNDVFVHKLPAREMLVERLTIALHDRFGLYKMDQLIWASNKAPGPVQWASLKRTQLNVGWEPIYWGCLNPLECYADNRRVLQPFTERHAKLIAKGGESRAASYTDGRYNIREGSFSNKTAGAIPRNVLKFPTTCQGQRKYKQAARAMGLPVHGAPWPESLVEFLIKFLTLEGMLVADICSGSLTTPAMCEKLNRKWLACETNAEFLRAGATRLPDVWINPDLDEILFGNREGSNEDQTILRDKRIMHSLQ